MSTDQTHISVVTDESLTVGLKSWSRGQKSQAASAICPGGVSAVIGSSDLDEHTFGSGGASGNQLSCSLPLRPEPSDVGFDLLDQRDRVKNFAYHVVPAPKAIIRFSAVMAPTAAENWPEFSALRTMRSKRPTCWKSKSRWSISCDP